MFRPSRLSVRAGIQHLANEVDAKATDLGLVRPKGDVRLGLIERIEFPSVVADFNVEAVFRNLQADNDLMLPGVVVAVFDGIGHDFLNGEVGGENDAFGCVIDLEKLRRCIGRRGKIIEIAIDLEDDTGHGRKVSQTRKIAPSFFPRMRLAPTMVVPRKHMAQTPKRTGN